MGLILGLAIKIMHAARHSQKKKKNKRYTMNSSDFEILWGQGACNSQKEGPARSSEESAEILLKRPSRISGMYKVLGGVLGSGVENHHQNSKYGSRS